MEGRGMYADGEPRRFGMATQSRGQSSNPFLRPDSGSSGFSSDQDVFGASVRSELAPGVADREFVRALLESNRTMQRILVQQQHQQQEQQQALAAALTRIAERDPPQFVVRQAAPPPVPPRVTREALEQIAEFKGVRGDDANDWVAAIDELGQRYSWAASHYREAATSKLRDSAKDWHMETGVRFRDWNDWRVHFLLAFGRVLTIDQWSRLAIEKKRRLDESIRSYCYAKLRLCRRCPHALSEEETIRYLVLGLNEGRAENVILAARPRTLASFFRLVGELEDFERDSELFSNTNPFHSAPANPANPFVSMPPPSYPPPLLPPTPLPPIPNADSVTRADLDNIMRRIDQLATYCAPPAQQWRPANYGPQENFTPRAANPGRRDTVCWRCHRSGHIASDCPVQANQGATGQGPAGNA